MGNFHKVETKMSEYSNGLKRILSLNPLMTETELASKLAVSSAFIRQRLSLNKITNKEVLALIDEGKITLANAYLLAKLPEEELPNFIDAAITEPPAQFIPKANARIKEIKEAARKGRSAEPITFVAPAHLQKIIDIKEALEKGDVVAKLIDGIGDPAQAAVRTLEWILHLDPKSVAIAEQKWNDKQAAKKAAKEKKAADKQAAKDKIAAEATLKIS